MKKISKLLRILATVTILAVLAVAVPASPALAANDVDLAPEQGEIGDWVDITGEDWPESDYDAEPPVYSDVDIYFSDEEADEGDYIDDVDNYESKLSVSVDERGDFDTRFKVPVELTDGDDDVAVTGGDYYFYFTYEDSDRIRAVADFTVIAAEITLSITDGAVGTQVKITGVDFNDNEDITIEYDGADITDDIVSGDSDTSSAGSFSSTIAIPASTAGVHTIKVTDDTGSEATADFTVEPELTASPTKGAPGDKVTVKGTGFGKSVDVVVEFDGDSVVSDTTDTKGSFDTTFTVPVKTPGTYDIDADDDDRNDARASFTVAAGVQLDQAAGNVGSQLAVSGAGFLPNATVTITYTSTPVVVATTVADAEGRFSATFDVPKSTGGQHTITASDGTNTATTTFTMETVPPPAPKPQLPLDGDKAKSQAEFDWDDVTDDSGVTYTLQIATDKNFTSPSMVLEKPGIAESGYTLSKEERLESTDEEAPYYWRVQAVDGADNESGWTSPGSFYVGFSFSLTGWVLYTLMAVAGLLLLFIGYLLGRRSAYF